MAVVVLLRGANLGSKRFSTKDVVRRLADLEVESVGAAGTFVVRRKVAEATLLARLASALPFEPEAIVVSEADWLAVLKAGGKVAVPEDARRFATALASRPPKPRLPLEAPSAGPWGVRVVAIEGPFALGVRRSVAATGVYPNEVIEKAFGVRATTRDWPTLEKVGALLKP